MKKVIFSCQNNQELLDLAIVAEIVKRNENIIPILYDMTSMTGFPLDKKKCEYFDKKYGSISFFFISFSRLNIIFKVIISLINALNIIRIMKQEKSTLCVTGVPLLTFRLLGFFGVPRISYLRGVIAQSEKNTSVSSKLFHWLKNVSDKKPLIHILSDYYSEDVICTGSVTESFLKLRSVPSKNIHVLGSIYCDSHRNKSNEQTGVKQKCIVFLSSAFGMHGYNNSQKYQLDLIMDINQILKNNFEAEDYKFIVKKHPREVINTYKNMPESILVDDVFHDVLNYPSETLYISPISTLLFELAELGRKVALISNNDLLREHGEWYRAMHITPELDHLSVLRSYMSNNEMEQSNIVGLNYIICDKYRGNVVGEFIKLIKDRC